VFIKEMRFIAKGLLTGNKEKIFKRIIGGIR